MKTKSTSALVRLIRTLLVLVLVLALITSESFAFAANTDNDSSMFNASSYEIEVGQYVALSNQGAKVTYKSSDSRIAAVSQNGVVTGMGVGTATITATIYSGNPNFWFFGRGWGWGVPQVKTYTFKVKEHKVEPTAPVDNSQHVKVGESIKLTVNAVNVTWTSSNPFVAQVSPFGVVIGIKKGSATITATYQSTTSVSTFWSFWSWAKPVSKTTTKSFEITVDPADPIVSPSPSPSTPPVDPKPSYPPLPDNPTEKDLYYWSNSTVVDVFDASTSPDVPTEADVADLLEERGFANFPITYTYAMGGEYIGLDEQTGGTDEKRPMYQTTYCAATGNYWFIYVINGQFFASPISYNISVPEESRVLISESEQLTCYDNLSNQYYVVIPYDSVTKVKCVERIDAQTLDSLTNEEIDAL